MNSILYVGMDVHKENYTLCCYSFDRDKVEYRQTVPSDYRLILKYLEQVRRKYPEEVEFICGYEAGCLGYSLYHQLTDHGVKCIIYLTDKLERLDARIEELARNERYGERVRRLGCFIGIKPHTALSLLVEVGDFRRFEKAPNFAGFLGLVPGEDSSGGGRNRLAITKAGNSHLRRLLVESSQSYSRGTIGFKSKELKKRQEGNPPEVVAYADRANERLRRRYYRMTLKNGAKRNVAIVAVARELACFVWGMMTDEIA